MDEFLHHAPCPNCGSRDNLGVYTQHEFCFGCSYTKYYNPLQRHTRPLEGPQRKPLWVPDDIVTMVPYQAHEWLKKYGLTQRELIDNNVVWSDKMQLLIFLYTKHSQLLGWQGRYFGTDTSKPKWWGQGNLKEINHILSPKKGKELFIVEDIISAIKISRLYPCKPCFGSYIDIYSIYNIVKDNNYTNICIHLDRDKRLESYKFSIKLNSIGIKTRVVSTKQDPKDYTTEELKTIYESQINNYPVTS